MHEVIPNDSSVLENRPTSEMSVGSDEAQVRAYKGSFMKWTLQIVGASPLCVKPAVNSPFMLRSPENVNGPHCDCGTSGSR
jgi:hypothetical protein